MQSSHINEDQVCVKEQSGGLQRKSEEARNTQALPSTGKREIETFFFLNTSEKENELSRAMSPGAEYMAASECLHVAPSSWIFWL